MSHFKGDACTGAIGAVVVDGEVGVVAPPNVQHGLVVP